MAAPFVHRFSWDTAKAAGNRRKHGVEFELAATVFRDPLALTVYDEAHAEREERWVTVGQAENMSLLVVVHTYEPASDGARIRIISARKATAHERQQYQSD